MEPTKRGPDVTCRHESAFPAPMTDASNSCNISHKIGSTSLRNPGRVIWVLLLVLLFAVPGGVASFSSGQAGVPAALLNRNANLCGYASKHQTTVQSPKQSLQKKRSEQIVAARRRRRRRSLQAVALRTAPLPVRSTRSNGLNGHATLLRFLSNSGRSPPSTCPSLI